MKQSQAHQRDPQVVLVRVLPSRGASTTVSCNVQFSISGSAGITSTTSGVLLWFGLGGADRPVTGEEGCFAGGEGGGNASAGPLITATETEAFCASFVAESLGGRGKKGRLCRKDGMGSPGE